DALHARARARHPRRRDACRAGRAGAGARVRGGGGCVPARRAAGGGRGVHVVLRPRGAAGRRGRRPADRARPRLGRAPAGAAGGGAGMRLLLSLVGSLHSALYRASGARIGGTMKQAPVLLLTTKGRKTGKMRTTPLLYGRDGDRIVLVASVGGAERNPAWFHNLKGHKGRCRSAARSSASRRASPRARSATASGRRWSSSGRPTRSTSGRRRGGSRSSCWSRSSSRRALAARSTCGRARRTPLGGSR